MWTKIDDQGRHILRYSSADQTKVMNAFTHRFENGQHAYMEQNEKGTWTCYYEVSVQQLIVKLKEELSMARFKHRMDNKFHADEMGKLNDKMNRLLNNKVVVQKSSQANSFHM